jgi:hypothetical protein
VTAPDRERVLTDRNLWDTPRRLGDTLGARGLGEDEGGPGEANEKDCDQGFDGGAA